MTEMQADRILTRETLLAMRARGEAFILIDVLAHEHFTHLHLPGAINVPLSLLRDLAPLLFGHGDTLVVYCADLECTASATAGKILGKLDFLAVYEYRGGLKDWIEAGLPVVRHEATVAPGA